MENKPSIEAFTRMIGVINAMQHMHYMTEIAPRKAPVNSIYLDEKPIPGDIRDRIGFYGCELATCERLLTMGYKYSNRVDLGQRADWLDKEIARLEALALKMRR